MNNRTLLKTASLSSLLLAVCCFTPALVVLLGALGLGAYVAGLDFILLPLLGLSLLVMLTAFVRQRRRPSRSEPEQ